MSSDSLLAGICRAESFPVGLLAGREEILGSLRATLTRPHGGAVWLHGPRRVGKTVASLAVLAELTRDSRSRMLKVKLGSTVDGSRCFWERLGSAARASISGICQDDQRLLESLADAANETPIIVFLEGFDAAAVHLDEYAQARLRAFVESHPKVSLVIESRREPSTLLEDVEVNSRLVGVCDTIPVRLLEEVDVVNFCRNFATLSERPELSELGKPIYSTVGGFPFLVTRTVQHVYRGRKPPSTLQEVEEAIEDAAIDIEDDIRDACLRLPPDVRAAWIDPGHELHSDRRRLKKYGLFNRPLARMHCPSALVEAAGELLRLRNRDLAELTALKRVDKLQELVLEANNAISSRTGRDAFKSTHRTLVAWSFARLPCSRDVFNQCVADLYRLLWEGTRKGSGAEAQSLLPEPLARRLHESEATRWVNVLRNATAHNQAKETDADRRNADLERYGDVCHVLSGSRSLDTDQMREIARSRLITGVLEFLEALCTAAKAAETDGTGRIV